MLTCILRADVVLSFSDVTFLLFLFHFRLFLLLSQPRPFVKPFLVPRYACAPAATRSQSYLTSVCVLFCFVFFVFLRRGVAFPEYFVPLFFPFLVWRVPRTFPPSGWCFSTLRPRAGFFTSVYYVKIQSINRASAVPTSTTQNRLSIRFDSIGDQRSAELDRRIPPTE